MDTCSSVHRQLASLRSRAFSARRRSASARAACRSLRSDAIFAFRLNRLGGFIAASLFLADNYHITDDRDDAENDSYIACAKGLER